MPRSKTDEYQALRLKLAAQLADEEKRFAVLAADEEWMRKDYAEKFEGLVTELRKLKRQGIAQPKLNDALEDKTREKEFAPMVAKLEAILNNMARFYAVRFSDQIGACKRAIKALRDTNDRLLEDWKKNKSETENFQAAFDAFKITFKRYETFIDNVDAVSKKQLKFDKSKALKRVHEATDKSYVESDDKDSWL